MRTLAFLRRLLPELLAAPSVPTEVDRIMAAAVVTSRESLRIQVERNARLLVACSGRT
jgi:hypothetical protein